MIRSYKDYKEYVREDLKAMNLFGCSRLKLAVKGITNWTLKFQLALRRAEYHNNCCKYLWQKPLAVYHKIRCRRIGNRCGFTIPLNVCGKGLSIAHQGTIVINGGAKIGDYCRIHACVNIGTTAGKSAEAPTVGDRVYIGPGAKLYGPITIASDIAIGANAVVNKDFTTPGISIGGIPARQISDKGSQGLLYAPKE